MFGSKITMLARAEFSRVAAPGLDEFDEVTTRSLIPEMAVSLPGLA